MLYLPTMSKVRVLSSLVLVLSLMACKPNNSKDDIVSLTNYLHDIKPFANDSLVNVVIEIAAGTNQKWELNKENGKIEWEKISTDSFRIVNYLPYPANYGFVPQTLLATDKGGDGDPVDVFVIGETMPRNTVCKVRIVGIIYMLDNNAADAKLLGVTANDKTFGNVRSLSDLTQHYNGVVDILKIWLSNYKGANKITVDSMANEVSAISYLKKAHNEYVSNKN